MFGPGEPNNAPFGCTPSTRSPGRLARQSRAGGSVTPAARLGSLRGWSPRTSETNGSVGIVSLFPSRSEQQSVHQRVVERLPRRLDDVLAHADRRPVAVAVGRVDQHTGDRPGALRGV